MRTTIGIVGAGPAGLMLSHLLHREGIASVVVENRSRDYVESRVRAGIMEQWVADLIVELGLGARMKREGLAHDGTNFAFDGSLRHIDFRALTGKGVMLYGQQDIVKDLIAARLDDGGEIFFDAEDVSIHEIDSSEPVIRFRKGGQEHTLACDFIGGCDGFHGVCRPSIPDGVLRFYERTYPFGWLGILTASPPPDHELIYAYHARGFALFSMRSPTVSRLYLQSTPEEDINQWPDQRIWDELDCRLGGVRPLARGTVLQKGVTPMRSFVTEPMQYGRLFLTGDAAHIVPPTGAKGMNLAIADVLVLARAVAKALMQKDLTWLESYSSRCLNRIWKAQRFSWWMTAMLHRFDADSPFDQRRQLAELDYVTSSRAASMSLAENYVGLPLDLP